MLPGNVQGQPVVGWLIGRLPNGHEQAVAQPQQRVEDKNQAKAVTLSYGSSNRQSTSIAHGRFWFVVNAIALL